VILMKDCTMRFKMCYFRELELRMVKEIVSQM